MPERIYPSNIDPLVKSPNWSAIWAGMFTFLAIWSVFEMLGAAIFLAATGTAISVGMGIWSVVLAIIAMFVAGRVTGNLSGFVRTGEAVMSGIVMFGLSVAAIVVISAIRVTGFGLLAGAAAARGGLVLGALTGIGWFAFAALFLGWLAAIAGSSSSVRQHEVNAPTQEVRRVA